MDIGFIGIGAMGAAMVPNLVRAGHRVSVWNRSRDAAEALEGVEVLDSPVAAFDNQVVLSMLANDAALRSVVVESGALAAARPGCIHGVMATISPVLADELQALHREAGVVYVAAPVFGVPAAAAKAQLNVMAAGDPASLDILQPIFDVLAQKTWRLGDEPTRAHVCKIAGNLMITLAIEAMGEATALTERYGLSGADFLEVITQTIMAAPSYQRYGGFIATDTYEPGFKLKLGFKDVNLAIDAATAAGARLPSAEIVRDNMRQAIDEGLGDKDWSVFAKVARQRAGFEDPPA